MIAHTLENGGQQLGIALGKIRGQDGALFVLRHEHLRGDPLTLVQLRWLELQAFHQRTDTQTQGTDVVHIVYLQDSQILTVSVQNLFYLINNEGIGTASEGSKLYKMDIILTFGHIMRRFENTVGISPLRHAMYLFKHFIIRMISDILRNHINAHIADAVGNLVLDHRVNMIRTTSQ